MKKLFATVLTAVVTCSMLFAGVHAEGENKLAGAAWDKGYCASIESYEDEGTTIYKAMYKEGDKSQWWSPTISVLDAVKAAMGEEESADIVLVFSIRAIGAKPDDVVSTGCRTLLRGVSAIKDKDEFDTKYEEALDGSDPLFGMSGGNIQKGFTSYTISNQAWTDIEISLEGLEHNQVFNDVVTTWNLCIDNIKNCNDLLGLEVKNAGVYLAEDYDPAENEEPGKAEQNNVANGAVATQSPARTPEPADETEVVVEKTSGGVNVNVIFYAIGGVLIVASAALIAVTVAKKPKAEKTQDKAE